MYLCQRPFFIGLKAGLENEVTTKLGFSDFTFKSSSVTD